MPDSATAGGFLLVLAIVLPVAGMLLPLAFRGRQAERIALTLMPAGLAVAVAIAVEVWRTRNVLQYFVGSWDPPLGVAFRADGLSAAMLVATALLVCGIGLFARGQFSSPEQGESRAPLVFWTLLLAVWGALNAVFIGGDLFNLYVALELLTFAAVPLVSLDGRCPPVVRYHAENAGAGRGAGARCPWRCRDTRRQRCGAAASAAETADCLLDSGADRLPVSDVSARRQAGNRPPVGHICLDRWRSPGHLARLCEGGHVHGGRNDRRSTRARPDKRARR